MKLCLRSLSVLLLSLAAANAGRAQETAFTYQGRLSDNGGPANGQYDLRFTLYDAFEDGAQVGKPVAIAPVGVSNGLFVVTLDFGAESFPGENRWVEIAIRPYKNEAEHIPLSPRQAITGTPYAIRSRHAGTAGSAASVTGPVAAGQITGSISGDQLAPGAALSNIFASGQSAVASGGLVLSATENAALVNAGYVRINARVMTEDIWQQRPNSPGPSSRASHSVVWTGTEMIIWGGYNGSFLNDGARYNSAANTWTALSTDGAPAARTGHTAVWTGTEMIIWGGANTVFLNNGGRYDPAANTWRAVSTNGAPSARYEHTAVWTGSEMIVWGGSSGGFFNNGARYDPRNDTWTSIGSNGAPGIRTRHTAVWTGTQMIIWGGLGAVSPLADGARYNPTTDAWTPTATSGAASARAFHTAVWTGNEMIVWGGFGADYLGDGARYNPSANSWIVVPNSFIAARRFHSAVWTGTEMLVWGGFNGSYFNDGGGYNPTNNSWSGAGGPYAPARRREHTAVWTGREMIVWGGSAADGSYLNNGSRFDSTANTSAKLWTAVTSSGALEGRWGPTVVWTGSEMIVWGGQGNGSGNFRADGMRYNPAVNNWAGTPIQGAPEGRRFHTALWTGTEMIIWGGWTGGYVNTGARYNPVGNTWTAMTTSSAPLGRASHVAVWTGSDMIVWGGYSGDTVTYYNNGGRYNPSANTWAGMSSAGAPVARLWHSGVWTGTEMIVWGGMNDLNSASQRNDGGRYNPTLNNWSVVTTNGAPSARDQHTAVWTGSEMIIWGQNADGGRYDPAKSTWTAVSATGAPTAGSEHTAVWTGSEMIVWGGSGGGGGRYSPSDNFWTAVAAKGAPSARQSHTAVWTGSEMLVWGGYAGDFFTDTWSYTPGKAMFLYQKP